MNLLRLWTGTILIVVVNCAHAGAVVIAKDAAIDDMSIDRVRRIFLGNELVMEGVQVVLITQTNEAARSEFDTKVLGMTEASLEAYWVKQIFTGKAPPPKELANDAEVRLAVARTPGAIGYVSDPGVDSAVKVIFKY